MIKSYLILMVTLLSVYIGSSQSIPGVIKGNNTIVIKTNLSEDDAFKTMIQILAEKGFPIRNTDKDLHIINTGEMPSSKLSCTIKLNVFVTTKDSSTILLVSGLFILDVSISISNVTTEPSWSKIEYKGMKGSPYRVTFNDMYEIAKSFPEAILTFETK